MAKTIVGKLIESILDVFKRNFPEFVKALWKKVPDKLQDQIAIIIEVVSQIDKFVQSPVADVLTSIIPGTADDRLKEILRTSLPVLLEKYKDLNNVAKHNIATELVEEYTGSDYGQSVITAEVAYQNLKKLS